MSLDVNLIDMIDEYTSCPHCGQRVEKLEITHRVLYSANITHNLNTMAKEAGIYKHLWRPEELGITKSVELVAPLNKGLSELKAKPEYFKRFNPANGWGDYENLVKFVEDYIVACVENPDAIITVSR